MLSFGGVLSHGSSADESHILIWMFFNCIASRTDAGDTYNHLWKKLVWSLYWLFKGRWPTHSSDGVKYTAGGAAERAGKLLAAGYYGVLWFLRFDNDAAQGTFHLADHNNNKVCFFWPSWTIRSLCLDPVSYTHLTLPTNREV